MNSSASLPERGGNVSHGTPASQEIREAWDGLVDAAAEDLPTCIRGSPVPSEPSALRTSANCDGPGDAARCVSERAMGGAALPAASVQSGAMGGGRGMPLLLPEFAGTAAGV